MRLYHTTTNDRADRIMVEGFKDNATTNPRMMGVLQWPPGVFFGDVPALDDELFDGVGLFDFDAERQTFIAVETPARIISGIKRIDGDSTWPGSQFWAKAEVWNRLPRERLSLDAVIYLRLIKMNPKEFCAMQRWLGYNRDYNEVFRDRVARAVDEIRKAATT
jgi:hypothetical protein